MPATSPVSAPRSSRRSASATPLPRRTSARPRGRSPSGSSTPIEVKMSFVRRAASGEDIRNLARESGVCVRTMQRWCQSAESLSEFDVDHLKSRHRMRTSALPELDKALFEWVVEERLLNHQPSGVRIMEKAKLMNAELGGPASFQASWGWLTRFLKRHGLQSQSVSGEPLSSDPPAPAAEEFIYTTHDFPEHLDIDEGDGDNVQEEGLFYQQLPNRMHALPSEKTAKG